MICGPRVRHPEDQNAVTNPTLLVEVLSDSTEAYDREEKFEHYKLLPSLKQYVLVSQRERLVEVLTRTDDVGAGWTCAAFRDGDVATLVSIDARLDVRGLYDYAAEPAA